MPDSNVNSADEKRAPYRNGLRDAHEVTRFLARIARGVLRGSIDPRRGKVAVDAARALLLALQQGEDARKLAETQALLERVEAQQKAAQRSQ